MRAGKISLCPHIELVLDLGRGRTVVFPLSGPSPAGCFGVAATAQEFAGSQLGRREILSSFPAPGHPLAGG